MKKQILYFFACFIYWLCFFFTIRLVFLGYHYQVSLNLLVKDWIDSFLQGFWFDLSVSSFIMLFVSIVLAFSSFLRNSTTKWILHSFNFILLILLTALVSIDVDFFAKNGFRIGVSPIINIGETAEIVSKSPRELLVRQLIISTALLVVFGYVYIKNISKQLNNVKPRKYASPVVFTLIAMALVVPARGGVGKVALNPGKAFFHSNNMVNHSTVNLLWNISYSWLNKNELTSEGTFLTAATSAKAFNKLSGSNSTSPKLLKQNSPNIICWIFNNLSSKALENREQGGEFAKWNMKHGNEINFDRFYAAGDDKKQGIIALLSALPPIPNGTVLDFPERINQLPFLASEIRKLGYTTHLYITENSDEVSLEGYFNNGGFDKIFSTDSLGVADTISLGTRIYTKFTKEHINTDKPVFSIVLSAEMPRKELASVSFDPNKKMYTANEYVQLAQKQLEHFNIFTDSIKNTEQWEKLLLISTSDKGNIMPGKTQLYAPDAFKIPMKWSGGAVLKDSLVNVIGDQSDFAATLLSQLNYIGEFSKFSNNLLSDTAYNHAYYAHRNGFGFVSDSLLQVYEIQSRRFLIRNGDKTEEDLFLGKAIYDVVLIEYKNDLE